MIEIYGTDSCVFCNKAKELLETYNKEYTYIDVTETEYVTAAFFKRFPNVRTVPQIEWEGKHIGGYTELREWLKDYG
jgi:glutaredoxin